MSAHAAVVTVATRGKLEIHQVPTISPTQDEASVRVEWTASTPLDLHQNDGALVVKQPQILGDGVAGIYLDSHGEIPKEKAQQELITAPEYLFGVIPSNFTPQETVTLPNNFVTVFYATTTDLELSLPWPRPPSYLPPCANVPMLIWGGSSSVGQYALQILRYYGYTNLPTTSSPAHHALLQSYGATHVFEYRSPGVDAEILKAAGGHVPYVLDCIGSKYGSLAPLAKIATKGGKVAVLLPVVVKDASETESPEYEMDVSKAAQFAGSVEVRGVRTHFYLNNELFKEKLQSEIMPTLLKQGIVKLNRYRIIEHEKLLDRAQAAMNALRRKEMSGERLVWKSLE